MDWTADLIADLGALPPLGDPYRSEEQVVAGLLAASGGSPSAAEQRGTLRGAARATAARWIEAVRATPPSALSAQNLLATFPLNSTEGVALLRLAEALLRAPDAPTQTWLIAEKLAAFRNGGGDSGEGLVARVLNTALRFAGQFTGEVDLRDRDTAGIREWLSRSALRPMVIDGIRRFGEQFVFAQSLPKALDNAAQRPDVRVTYSYDMLGEGARAAEDADRSFGNYRDAIAGLASTGKPGHFSQRDGISVKLSAIHPRFETTQWQRVERELYGRLLELARQARDADVNFTIDAEESERLVMQVALFERLLREPSLAGWEGLGLAVQAYQTRAGAAIDHLLVLAKTRSRPIAIRLVKGAYWDAEIKRAQELGLPGFPVFTRKWATDLSYAVLAQRLLTADAPVYPQFATHNSLTAAWICAVADQIAPQRRFEFQRLHGMGEPLYQAILAERPDARVRVYAPVGAFRDLLAYLVRRLLENGANTSFVHQIADEATPVAELLADPFQQAVEYGVPQLIPTGARLFGDRTNSSGRDLAESETLLALAARFTPAPAQARAAPIVDGVDRPGTAAPVRAPARLADTIGHVVEARVSVVDAALASAQRAQSDWDARGADQRAALLDAAADAYERDHDALVQMLVHEAGKTALDAHFEVREAVDFLRYYATSARRLMVPQQLPGPTGESNELALHGRGVFVCISPWNFPLAIFTGQVAAALVTGNTVIAKPAEQTPLIAAQAVRLMHRAGVPGAVLHLLPGRGETIGRQLTSDARVAGVAFTGSTDTARAINRALAARDAPIGVLIAETGGQNAMLVDSTALPEQVTDAVLSSAFRSTGQRCSALRVLYVQNDIADGTLAMIAGAMRELKIGDPRDPSVDVGPVIDRDALEQLVRHRDWLRANARRLCEIELPPGLAERGHYFAPVAYEIDSMRDLVRENFGPILHVVRFDRDQFDARLDEINASGYGLTMGLHTRLDARVAQVRARAHAGNLYVNRNIIGAVVETQPFGGEGLSGTGPKAGGPFYLQRFCGERTVTINTAAAGGNIELAAGLSSA